VPRRPRAEDWQALGLEPGAPRHEVRRAYLERKGLYAAESIATYSLLEEDERQTLLARLDEAYERILGGAAATSKPAAPDREELPEIPPGPPPDAAEEPGAHLRHHRLRSGLLLAQVAEEIKVRSTLLDKLEHEQFGQLPAPVYVRGFVVQFARALGLPQPEEIARAYVSKMELASGGDEQTVPP
jgi:flagellar biosynthesis protein FlhG